MSAASPEPPIFRAGGTLPADAPSYIARPADTELPRQLSAGQLCYILTPRQMGKSSLMVRTAHRLSEAGACCATVDLSALGIHLSPAQWFLGILHLLAAELALHTNPDLWWQAQPNLPPAQRFSDFLADVVLTELAGQVVIFIDEIDTTLNLPFSDDFFAAIRATYNRRASEPAFQRLSIVLLGVAAPADLIKAPERTPFNLGRAIDLGYLSREDAAPFVRGLDAVTPGSGQTLLDRIFDWTSGHPYQTQRVCAAITSVSGTADADAVDAAVRQLFLAADAPEESLKTIERTIQAMSNRGDLLRLYRAIISGKSVAEDRRSPLQSRLLLTGLVRAVAGRLEVANQIYRQAFDLGWVRRTMPPDRLRLLVTGSLAVIVIALGSLGFFLNLQAQQTIDSLTTQYHASSDDGVRVSALVSLCAYSAQGSNTARDLFFVEPLRQQVQLAGRFQDLSQDNRKTFQSCFCDKVVERGGDYTARAKLSQVCPRSEEREP